jgi:predicted phosphodiesterase
MGRIAVLADIHGNSIALDAVLADLEARGGADEYWILGDLAAIGPDPIGTLERLVALPSARFARGNTDRYLVTSERPPPTVQDCEANPALWRVRAEVASSFSWTQGMVTAAGWIPWLRAMPLELRTTLPDGTRLLAVHAAPGKDEDVGLRPDQNQEALEALIANCQADLVLVGHTHWPMAVTAAGVHLVGVGSVSNAFPPDLRAAYGLLSYGCSGYCFEHRRVEYSRDAVVQQLAQIGYPAADFVVQLMRGEVKPPWA